MPRMAREEPSKEGENDRPPSKNIALLVFIWSGVARGVERKIIQRPEKAPMCRSNIATLNSVQSTFGVHIFVKGNLNDCSALILCFSDMLNDALECC